MKHFFTNSVNFCHWKLEHRMSLLDTAIIAFASQHNLRQTVIPAFEWLDTTTMITLIMYYHRLCSKIFLQDIPPLVLPTIDGRKMLELT